MSVFFAIVKRGWVNRELNSSLLQNLQQSLSCYCCLRLTTYSDQVTTFRKANLTF